ncbi:hypothetical protein QQ045_015534 [Rhodiola kirilowii]
MVTQLSGLRKRKSLEEGGSFETEITEFKPPNYKEAESQECKGGSAVQIDAMGETQDVTVSVPTNKLSAAVVSVDSQDDLIGQHAKVAEEAIAGWEKAEIEAMIMKQQLEALATQNFTLEDRANHLDGALKEVVNKLRLANEEQELKIREAVLKEMQDWQCRKTEFVNQILQLKSQIDSYTAEASNMSRKLGFLEEKNSTLKVELRSQSEELEIRTIERDLSAEAAEKASKQNLESIKKVARLEAECRRLRSVAHTALSVRDQKSGVASSLYADSLTDSQSDNGERLQATDIDFQNNVTSKSTECQTSCSNSHASTLFTSLNQPKSANMMNKARAGSAIEIDLMDDFLEIERLAALPEIVHTHCNEPETIYNNQPSSDESSLDEARSHYDKLMEKIDRIEAEKTDLQTELEKVKHQKIEIEDSLRDLLQVNNVLEEKVKRIEKEKSELESALTETQSSTKSLSVQLQEAEMKLNELQKELSAAYKTQQSYESQVMGYELEAKIMSSRVESLESKLKSERDLSAELTVKCDDLEYELVKTKQEVELLRSTISNSQFTIKQDDLAAAAGKLAECQQTIASLGIQLKSLASLDDFLTDTTISQESDEILGSDNAQLLTREQHDISNKARKSVHASATYENSPASSSSSSSASSVSQVSVEKGRNGFIKLFSRSNRGKVPA